MEYAGFSWTAGARRHRVSRAQVRHVVEHAGVFFVRAAAPPERPDEAVLFVGDDGHSTPLEVVGVELADGRLRVVHDDDAGELPGSVRGGGAMGDVKRDRGKPLTTKAGAALDARAEQRLAEEAEAGFDPATLTKRHAGRPSLSGGAGHSNRVDLRVDDETYEAIQRLADEGQGSMSDVVREAIRRYLEAS